MRRYCAHVIAPPLPIIVRHHRAALCGTHGSCTTYYPCCGFVGGAGSCVEIYAVVTCEEKKQVECTLVMHVGVENNHTLAT